MELDKNFEEKVNAALAELLEMGYEFVPFEKVRSPYKQGEIWRRSRTTAEVQDKIKKLKAAECHFLAECIESVGPQTGKWGTNAIPGLSWHQFGLAVDCYYKKDGKANWDDIKAYKVYRRVMLKHGLHRGPRTDWVHIQAPKESGPHKLYTLQAINEMLENMYKNQ